MRWATIYEKLIGQPPTAAQVARADRIREILRIRDDDSNWYYLVVNEFYVQTISANIKRLTQAGQTAKPVEVPPKASMSSQFWDLRRQPQTLAVVSAIFVSVMLASGITGIVVAATYARWDTQRSHEAAEQRIALQVETKRTVDAALSSTEAVRDAIAPLRDPRYEGLLEALRLLPAGDQQKLAADPAMTIRTLHVVAALTPEAQAAFDASNDPDTQQGATQLSAQAWFSAQITSGNQSASKLVAAYAAGNASVSSLLKKLPTSCSLGNLTDCRSSTGSARSTKSPE